MSKRLSKATDGMRGVYDRQEDDVVEEVWTFKRLAEDKPPIKIVRGWFQALAASITTEDDVYFA